METLWEAAPAAKAALRMPHAGGDAEVRQPREAPAGPARFGIRPDTPKEVTDLIEQYRRGEANEKATLASCARGAWPQGLQDVAGLISGETAPDVRADARGPSFARRRNVTPAMLAAGEFEKAEFAVGDGRRVRRETSIRKLRGVPCCAAGSSTTRSRPSGTSRPSRRRAADLLIGQGRPGRRAGGRREEERRRVAGRQHPLRAWRLKALVKIQQDSKPG